MPTPFAALQIERLAVHEVFKREPQAETAPPRFSRTLAVLGAAGMSELRERISRAMASDAKSIQMSIREDGPGSVFQMCARLLEADDDPFLEISKEITQRLAGMQHSRSIPGGVVVVLRGRVGMGDARLFAGVIKAEVHTGFAKESSDDGPLIKYLDNLLLTPQAKLHKIGLFVRETQPGDADDGEDGASPDDFSAYIFDTQMHGAEIGTAANYFYEQFLGCSVAPSSKKLTRDFYNHGLGFFSNAGLSVEQKVTYVTALKTYLRSERQVVLPVEFAREALPADLRQPFVSHLEEKGLPPGAFQKDNSQIKNRLRIRQLNFTGDIKITGPADRFEERVTISKEDDEVTTVTIRGRLLKQG
jgi:hypothetical protein